MKMTIDKTFTENWQMDRVKADVKEFKAMYTDGDILRSFQEQTEDYRTYAADIVYCKASAMDSGWAFGNVTTFCIEMMVEAPCKIYKLRFYIDMNLKIDNRPNLITVQVFKEE